jgi:hypothetical protein
MLALLSAVFGFAAPFLPEVVRLFREKADRQHELDMLRLRMENAGKEHSWRLEEINATADIEEAKTIRAPGVSFGVQLLDASKEWASTKWGRFMVSPVFWLFAFLDFASGMVRPVITYGVVSLWAAVKWEAYRVAVAAQIPAPLVSVWGEQDFAVLTLVLSYWFGSRAAKAAFGGSASTGRPGGG